MGRGPQRAIAAAVWVEWSGAGLGACVEGQASQRSSVSHFALRTHDGLLQVWSIFFNSLLRRRPLPCATMDRDPTIRTARGVFWWPPCAAWVGARAAGGAAGFGNEGQQTDRAAACPEWFKAASSAAVCGPAQPNSPPRPMPAPPGLACPRRARPSCWGGRARLGGRAAVGSGRCRTPVAGQQEGEEEEGGFWGCGCAFG